ncbi:sulfite exporter TauE/SafE family protein [Epibacterium ulvae]|uniref:sulfite exporter TauE/SafE family protein n=1 Tax=Epibacterium ulvae TaxID=1156985 RepID=UPI001BFC7E2A|nr:sulfite exporter TauE/SafE family protein [Epibacterium ulvae]MBT8153797.1 sulfite exporter TauE/SafE family protein [Epibacterium ulvae]
MDHVFLLSAATFAAGFLRGVTGFGFALAAVPIYSLIVSPIFAVILAQILQVAAAPVDLVQNHKIIDRRALGLLILGSLPGVVVGALVATQLSPDLLRLVIAALVMLGLVALMAKIKLPGGRGPALVAGSCAGLLAGLAAMPGPPAVAYFLGRGTDKRVSRASLLVFFAFTALAALSFVALTSDVLEWSMGLSAALAYPALLLGTWAGTKLFERLGDGSYRTAALGVLLVSALLTGAKGLQGLL